jgi:hypothetical protein
MKRSADMSYPPAQYSDAHFAQNEVGMAADYEIAQKYYLHRTSEQRTRLSLCRTTETQQKGRKGCRRCSDGREFAGAM